MTVAVIAAQGRTGRAFVRAALRAGHEVRAGVRGKHDFADHPHLQVVACDATNADDVIRLCAGADAVICLIGHVKHSPTLVQTTAIKHVLAAMDQHDIKRVLSLTGTGVRLPNDSPNVIDYVLNLAIRIIDPARVSDGKRHVGVLQKSSVEWTVLRVLKLTSGKNKPYRLTRHGPAELFSSRKEVAHALLDVLENHSYVRQAPILSTRSRIQ